jgi:type III restriction enzyme
MPRSVIAYDRDLPEIPDRCPWLPPDSHLVKDKDSHTGWRVAPGRASGGARRASRGDRNL